MEDWPLWRHGEQAEARYQGRQMRISAGTPYFRYEEGNFPEVSFPGDRLVLIEAVSIAPNDERAQTIPYDPELPSPTVDLRFSDAGQSCWVRAHLVTLEPALAALPLSGSRLRLSSLAVG